MTDLHHRLDGPADAPAAPAYVEIGWQDGVPTTVNGIEMSLVELINSLETIAGGHGVGRVDMVENRLVGIKSREVYEAPAGVILHQAHQELETLCLSKQAARFKTYVAQEYADKQEITMNTDPQHPRSSSRRRRPAWKGRATSPSRW